MASLRVLLLTVFAAVAALALKLKNEELLTSAQPKEDVVPPSLDLVHPSLVKNTKGMPWVKQRARPRRNRKSTVIRSMVQEAIVRPSNLVYPLFIHEDSTDVDISSMPGCKRFSMKGLLREVKESMDLGVKSFILFPKIENNLKTLWAEEAYNDNGLVPRAIRAIKSNFPEAIVITDIALDPYSSKGHDGVVIGEKIINDETIVQLIKQALCHARAGADVVAPSDMMDGRVGAIRDALDNDGFTDVSVMAYTAKYASAFYGPFRDALDSHPGFGDKKTYQQDPSNAREALTEASLDASEGADFLLVKPALPYLDVVHRLRQLSPLPIAAYQVSGEYSMIKAAAAKGWLDEKKTVLESVKAIRRAGADVILTYYAKQVAMWLKDDCGEACY